MRGKAIILEKSVGSREGSGLKIGRALRGGLRSGMSTDHTDGEPEEMNNGQSCASVW